MGSFMTGITQDMGCGPSKAETQQAQASANFAQTLQANYGKQFGQQQDVLAAINRSLSPILAAGPSQQGFSAAESAALNTQAINAAGAASRNAQQAVANFGAGQGGGAGTGITSGIQQQLQSSVASQSANQLATAQNQITQANFNQGSQNYWKAAGGMNALAEGYSPNASMSGGISEGGQAFNQASTVQQQQQQADQALAGGVAGLAMDVALPGLGGAISGGVMGGGALGALQGGVNAVTGTSLGMG